jgi:transcriptional regulator NrdR family protein
MDDNLKTPKEPAGKRGLECSHCGCQHFRVLYTRRAWGGRLMRRRECRHCGRRITTYEVTLG